MGLRVAAIICVTSFLLGILFVHWIADSLTLWKPFITPENVWTCASYYSLFARAPPGMGYVLATVITLGAAFILWSFGDGAAGNLMFDGASIFLYGTAVAVYLYKIIPSFHEIFSAVPVIIPEVIQKSPVPMLLKSEALNLATANLVCSVALTGVMALQAARWWAEQDSDDEDQPEPGASSVPEDSLQLRQARKLLSRDNTNNGVPLATSRIEKTSSLR
ncbi:hypothetical protein PNOK_0035600 [Pyrrhoderma noxium]|uniref:Shr3 amino acid permease chaperone n=1 Tax=Pyrrhoderma noxium TaxID=2282107 RepID=A0A286UUN2_9AGAM|nr:hypothetical protein PNOK_0035600 [Pyrrhoderma noxium]